MTPSNSRYGTYDIGEDRLAQALARSTDPELLSSIAALARTVFGWFNRRATRADEYVWIVHKIGSEGGKTIADIGAGVSPLPIYLARKGNRLITIDHSSQQRILGQQRQAEWNGWGFFDYSQVEIGIRSINQDANDVVIGAQSLDCLYSVSVIEHLHSEIRRILWSRIWEWLKPGGDLLLTVDLEPNTRALWNFEQGQLVEEQGAHGDCECLITELRRSGFFLVDITIERNYPDKPPTDVGYLHLIRK